MLRNLAVSVLSYLEIQTKKTPVSDESVVIYVRAKEINVRLLIWISVAPKSNSVNCNPPVHPRNCTFIPNLCRVFLSSFV